MHFPTGYDTFETKTTRNVVGVFVLKIIVNTQYTNSLLNVCMKKCSVFKRSISSQLIVHMTTKPTNLLNSFNCMLCIGLPQPAGICYVFGREPSRVVVFSSAYVILCEVSFFFQFRSVTTLKVTWIMKRKLTFKKKNFLFLVLKVWVVAGFYIHGSSLLCVF